MVRQSRESEAQWSKDLEIFFKQNFKKRRAEGKENWKRALGTARENLILTRKTSRQNEEKKRRKTNRPKEI